MAKAEHYTQGLSDCAPTSASGGVQACSRPSLWVRSLASASWSGENCSRGSHVFLESHALEAMLGECEVRPRFEERRRSVLV
jgi:hypothetical protein